MKIAVSGAHWTGKTTLVEELCQVLPDHLSMNEPYYHLEEEGHTFPEMPGIEDFELQLDYSIKQITNSEENTIFDRCPVDMLAYLVTHYDFERFDLRTWLPKIQDAMEQLDLIVFVPIEEPDLITCPEWENTQLRSCVNEELHDIILGNVWHFNLEVLEVQGTLSERLQQVYWYVLKSDKTLFRSALTRESNNKTRRTSFLLPIENISPIYSGSKQKPRLPGVRF